MRSFRRPTRGQALLLVLGVSLGAAAAQGQAPVAPVAPPDDATRKVAAAAAKWVESDQSTTELLDATVVALLLEPPIGIRWLAENLPAALTSRQEPRSKGVVALATHVSLEFVRRQNGCGMVFAGQYDALRPLQPFVGDLLFLLLLDTPDWYPDTHRGQLVPALRDLQPVAPAKDRLDRVVAIVENVEVEPEPLRVALSCMLWQWGRKEFAQTLLEKLQRDSTEGDTEDRVRTMLELADLQYRLREYKSSAAAHRSLHALAASTHYRLKPVDYYSAACVHALLGNVDRGIEALQKCAEQQVSPQTDSSHRLERKLLENDPEIAVLRRDARWPAIFASMFPKEERPAEAGGR